MNLTDKGSPRGEQYCTFCEEVQKVIHLYYTDNTSTAKEVIECTGCGAKHKE